MLGFCLTAVIEALGTMMEQDAEQACGPLDARGDGRRGHRWGQTHGKMGFHSGKVAVERKPYLDRNKDIVLETQTLVATPAETTEQLRSGTWSTVRYARKLKRPAVLILPDGTIVFEHHIQAETA